MQFNRGKKQFNIQQAVHLWYDEQISFYSAWR